MANWQAGTLYSTGAIVSPATAQPVVQSAPNNPGFEEGATGFSAPGWTLAAGLQVINPNPTHNAFDGTQCLYFVGSGWVDAQNTNVVPVTPGQRITAWCMVQQRGDRDVGSAGLVRVMWYDASSSFISVSEGVPIGRNTFNYWSTCKVVATAPAGAAYARIAVAAYRGSGAMLIDGVGWDYVYAARPEGMVYKAVQDDVGTSASTEPLWPVTEGEQVTDGTVIWEAVLADRVIWEATPILKSGGTEPEWPLIVGGSVIDGTIVWAATASEIADAKCPQSHVVAIGASKVFAADEDIISYCATVNPLDWSSANDAGYLPFGLQNYGSNPVAALGLYRSNLVAFNAAGFQMWQIDEDPANMALLDAVPVGCTHHKSLQPVQNDLVFASQIGIRNIGIAGASTNLQAGDFGKQIDQLVQPKLAAGTYEPLGLFVPSLGQYWCIFGAEAFVLTINGSGTSDMSWSRYVFPSVIDYWTLHEGDLYLRSGTKVWLVDPDALLDDIVESDSESGEPFEGYIAWPYLDLGELGLQKMLHGFDLVCTGEVAVSVGWNQTNEAHATTPYTLDGDTLPGGMIPMPLNAPSVQMRLTFTAGQAWEFQAASIYVEDQRRGA